MNELGSEERYTELYLCSYMKCLETAETLCYSSNCEPTCAYCST